MSHNQSVPASLTIPVILPQPTENPLQHNPHYVLYWFPYFALPHLTTKPCANPSQANFLSSYIRILIPYGSNTLPIKKLSLFPLKLDNTANNNSISNTQNADFCIKQQVLLHFSQCYNFAYNHLFNLQQKFVPLLQSNFTSLFRSYLFTKSSL